MKPCFTIGSGPVDNPIAPLRLAHGTLEGDVVLRQGGRRLNMRGERDKPVENSAGSDEDAVEIGVLRDPLRFRQSADIFRFGADNIHSLFFGDVERFGRSRKRDRFLITVQPGPQSRASPVSSPRTFFMASTQAATVSRPRSRRRLVFA